MAQALWIISATLLVLQIFFFAASHWFPWHVFPFLVEWKHGQPTGQPKHVFAYIYGVGGIIALFAVWALAHQALGVPTVDVWTALLFLVLDAAAACLGTVLPRVVEREREYQALQQDVNDGPAVQA